MKHVWIVLFALPLMLIGQSKVEPFEFTLYCEDGKGNRDTLILGYHPEAHSYPDSMELNFGEVDISSRPFNKEFEARSVNRFNNTKAPIYFPHSKKQISPPPCQGVFYTQIVYTLAFRIDNPPLRLSWDRTLFDSLNYPLHFKSFFATSELLFLLPQLPPSLRLELSKDSSYTFDPRLPESSLFSIDRCIEVSIEGASNAEVCILFLEMSCGKEIVSTYPELLDPSHIYPNPASGKLNVAAPPQSQLRFTDIWSRELTLEVQRKGEIIEIDVSRLPNGIYQVAIEEKGKAPRVGRWVKE